MKIKELINPFKSIWQFIGFTFVGSILINLIFWQGAFTGFKPFILGTIWSSLIWITQWLGNVYVGIKIEKKYSWLEHPKKRFFVGLFAIIIYSVLAYAIVQTSMYFIFLGGVPKNYFAWMLNQVLFILPISPVIAFTFTSIGFFKNWKKSVINEQKLETEMLRYKYESLQNQINPHFLFNSFNVLTEIIDEDKNLAKEFVQKMSGLYRYVLESREKELVTLSEEVEFIKKYLFLLETRFENKLQFSININNYKNKYIVPMALQLLVENAVKHNVASSKKVLNVEIYEKENSIVVSNNIQAKNTLENSTKTGLKNLKQQYEFFTIKNILIEKKGGNFIVEIPLLEKQKL